MIVVADFSRGATPASLYAVLRLAPGLRLDLAGE